MRASADALRAYCLERVGATTSDEDGVSLAAFALDVREGRTTTREVVIALGDALTSVEPSPRARATEILVAIAREAMETLDDGSVGTLGAFFAGRLADHSAAGRAAAGAAACAARADGTTIEAMARGLFVECDAQSLRQSDREACGRLAIEMLRGEHRGACVRGAGDGDASEALARIIGAFDGEKDPRCVLGLCEVWTLLPAAFDAFGARGTEVYAENAEELYDVAASYFPVSFKPPRGDSIKISRRQLAEAVERAMCASPTFAPWAVSHALESLNPELGPGKMADAARAVRAMGEQWGARVMEPYLETIWNTMRAALAHPNATNLEDDADARATTPMSVMTTMFASEFGGAALARAALSDACMVDAESTFRRLSSERSKEACAMETTDAGCCGGGCGGSDGGDDAARGRLVAATASRVLGAVAAASPALARDVIEGTLKRLLDAGGISMDVQGANPSATAYLSLILATPALGGALDCCEKHAHASEQESVLGSESGRLVGLFSSGALGIIESHAVSESIVLGLAGIHMLCKFPGRFGLADAESRVAAGRNLYDAMMKDHAGESESDTEMRQERAIAALVAAVSAGDEMFEATMTRGGSVDRLERALVERDIETVEAKRAVRALVALANANQTIRDRVARLFCDTFRELGATAATAGGLARALCEDDDGVLTRFVTSDDARRACEDLVEYLSTSVDVEHSEHTTRVLASAVANCDAAAQTKFAERVFDDARQNPLVSCAVVCGLAPDASFDVNRLTNALEALVEFATSEESNAASRKFVAAAVGSATHKFPTATFVPPTGDLGHPATTLIVGACVRARAMRRDDAPEFKALVSRLFESLDAETPATARGAAVALGMAVGFDADARDVGLGLRTCTHANEKFLSRQRFFATIAPRLTEDAHRAVGVRRLSRAYAAVKLAGGVPASVALSPQFKLFALLPDVLRALTLGTLARDDDALRATVLLVGSRLADPTLRDPSDEGEDERLAPSLVDALASIAVASPDDASMECRESALEALVAVATLAFSAVYPCRERALDAALAACDDPKRRVRRAAAAARQVWMKITSVR